MHPSPRNPISSPTFPTRLHFCSFAHSPNEVRHLPQIRYEAGGCGKTFNNSVPTSTEPLCLDGDTDFPKGKAERCDKCCGRKRGGCLRIRKTCLLLDLASKEAPWKKGPLSQMKGVGKSRDCSKQMGQHA